MKPKLLFLLVLFLTPFAGRTAATWNGPSVITLADWNNAANWLPASVPTPSESVTFNTAVTIAGNVPLTSANQVKIQSAVTIGAGVVLTTGSIVIEGGTLVNDGVLTGGNLTYSNAGGIITNNGTLNLNNLNTGNATTAGSFTNNGSLSVTNNIVVEEGIFDNNPGASVITVGITVQNGGTIQNGGNMRSNSDSSVGQVTINGGGVFTNEATGVFTVDLTRSNVYGIRVYGTMTNLGTTSIGVQPYNPASQGLLVGSGGHFSNTGSFIFSIDPTSCVIIDNHGASGSFFSVPVTVITGNNCMFSPLPVSLKSFNGVPDGCGANIAWETAFEADLSDFVVEQSTDGIHFTQVALQPAKNVASVYKLRVNQLAPVCFYRLVTLHRDGSRDISATAQVKISCDGALATRLVVHPNPINKNSIFSVAYNNTVMNGPADLLIMNAAGKSILSQKVIAGNGIVTCSAERLATGLYYIQLRGKDWRSTVGKLLVQ